MHLHCLPRFNELRTREVHGQGAGGQRDRKGCHSRGERAHENLGRVRVAEELHIDVTVALDSFGYGNGLHATSCLGGEPVVGIDLVALDSDQA